MQMSPPIIRDVYVPPNVSSSKKLGPNIGVPTLGPNGAMAPPGEKKLGKKSMFLTFFNAKMAHLKDLAPPVKIWPPPVKKHITKRVGYSDRAMEKTLYLNDLAPPVKKISICTPPPGREVYRETVPTTFSPTNLELHPSPNPGREVSKVARPPSESLSSPPIFWLGGTAYAMSPPINTLVPPITKLDLRPWC